MHSVELDTYYQAPALSQEASRRLIEQPFEETTWAVLQKELNAYTVFNKETFAGIAYHDDGKGPENPYYNPKGNDWDPIVQATARIGAQAQYWNLVAGGLKENRLDFIDLISAEILPVFPVGNGQIQVLTNSYPDFLSHVAKKAGDTVAKYPKYISLVNYGGDADFYGSWANQIFPMNVRDSKGTHSYVPRNSLSLKETDVEATWQNWKNLHTAYGAVFFPAFKEMIVRLPYPLFEYFNGKIQEGERFDSACYVIRDYIMDHRKSMSFDKLEPLIDELIATMKIYLRNESGNPILIEAYQKHADGLTMLYETAKTNRQDVYHY